MKMIGKTEYAIIPILGFRRYALKNLEDSFAPTNWISTTNLNGRVSVVCSKDGLKYFIVKLEIGQSKEEAIEELRNKHNEGIIMDRSNRELKSYASVTTERDLNGFLGYL